MAQACSISQCTTTMHSTPDLTISSNCASSQIMATKTTRVCTGFVCMEHWHRRSPNLRIRPIDLGNCSATDQCLMRLKPCCCFCVFFLYKLFKFVSISIHTFFVCNYICAKTDLAYRVFSATFTLIKYVYWPTVVSKSVHNVLLMFFFLRFSYVFIQTIG